MSLPHALLGVINYAPLTGYDLKTAFNASVNMFWNASLPQIYRTLHRMEKDGWVRSRIEHQEGKPNRKIYEITDQGRKALRTWLAGPLEVHQVKDQMMLKVFFGNQMDPHDLLEQIKTLRKTQIKFLQKSEADFKQSADHYAAQLNAHDDVRFWLLTLDFGRRKAQTVVDWCNAALEVLEKQSINRSR